MTKTLSTSNKASSTPSPPPHKPSPPPLPLSDDNVKVAIVNHTFRATDGQGKVNAKVAAALLDAGHSVTLAGQEVPDHLGNRANARVLPLNPVRGVPTQLLKHLAFGWRSAKAIRSLREDHDLIIANGGMSFAAADINLCHFVHAGWVRSAQHPWRAATGTRRLWGYYQYAYTKQSQWWERNAYKRAEQVVAVSDLVKQQLVDLVGIDREKVCVIENGLDPLEESDPSAMRAWAREQFGVSEETFVIFFAAELQTPRKNLDVLLHALKSLPESVVLVAAGRHEGGPYRAMVDRLGLSDRVRLLGFRDDVRRLYAGADVFALLSHYDPCPITIGEAMSVGVPILTAETVGSCALVRRHNAGAVVPEPTDVPSVVREIRRLLDDPEHRRVCGQNASNARSELSWELVGDRYVRLLEGLTESGASHRE